MWKGRWNEPFILHIQADDSGKKKKKKNLVFQVYLSNFFVTFEYKALKDRFYAISSLPTTETNSAYLYN